MFASPSPDEREIRVDAGAVALSGTLSLPRAATGLVVRETGSRQS